MSTLSLLISLVALVISVVAIVMANRAGAGGLFRAPPPPANTTLTGSIRITNDCDGQQASIPARVTVTSDLENAAGNVAVPGSTTVNLAPDPANPAAPVKIGTYTITVPWANAGGAAHHWTRPDVLDRPNSRPVCATISCSDSLVCRDGATATRTIAVAGASTTHDIRVDCACGGSTT